eukprot:SAG22_NODE_2808_length_2191_cov_1.463671_2_plen_58_part_00
MAALTSDEEALVAAAAVRPFGGDDDSENEWAEEVADKLRRLLPTLPARGRPDSDSGS